ncbi:MAG: enoyl-CoA hydratase/isomerase family protein [Alphaproteobacteria bacterium]|nr:enoyl-CoA hydratase/isomerase family protein [Alphaproteobacteria bacterium]
MTEPAVLYHREASTGFVTLNRPRVLNAINDPWITDLVVAGEQAAADAEALVVVLRGAGRAFCAGADLKATPSTAPHMPYRADHIDPMQRIARVFRSMRKPVIAAVHGYAVGGGCELAMLADMRLAAEGTKFGFTELRVGATVTMGGLYNLARIVGTGRAFELLYTTDLIDATEAHRIGLVNRVVPADELADAVAALASKVAGNFPFEMSLVRAALYRALDQDFDAALEEEGTNSLLSYLGGSRNTGMRRAMDAIEAKPPQ